MFSLPLTILQNRALVTFDGSSYNYVNIANFDCDGSSANQIFNPSNLSGYSGVGTMSQHALDYKLCKSGTSTSLFGASETFTVNHVITGKLKLVDGAGDVVQEFDLNGASTDISDTSQIRYDSAFIITDTAGTTAYSTFNIRKNGVTSNRSLEITIDSTGSVTAINYS